MKNPTMNVMQAAVRKVSGRMMRDFGEVENLQTSRKGPGDFVTVADARTDQKLIEALSKARPDYGFVTEEHGVQEGRDPGRRWIVDPIDGTMNFLHGIPHFCISIALQERGEITAAVVHHPVSDQMFWALRGIGAFLNDRRIRVSSRVQIADALIATGGPSAAGPELDHQLKTLAHVTPQVAAIRRAGSAALDLAYVAAGRYDVFWDRGLNIWQIAAGVLLVREAGGMVSTPDDKGDCLDTGDILACNADLRDDMVRMMKEVPAAE